MQQTTGKKQKHNTYNDIYKGTTKNATKTTLTPAHKT